MSQSKEQLFNDFVQLVTQHGQGVVYIRDPHRDVPPECGFIRVRLPGERIFTSVGIVKFRTRAEGVTACEAFAACSEVPLEWQMNFPRASPQTFSSPTFAEVHAVAQSRWLRWKRALSAWWPPWSRHAARPDRATT